MKQYQNPINRYVSRYGQYAISMIVIILSLCLHSTNVFAAGLMQPANSSLPALKIREHHVTVDIENGYTTTSIEQVFYNPNNSDLEAIYSFPVPDAAAVGEFIYWIGEQPVIGEVLPKQQARTIYETEKDAGRNTALIEKDAYKTFDMHVYPVKAGQNVKVRLVYIQKSHIESGIGRYLYPLEDGGTDEEKLSFWTRNESVEEKFSFNLRFRSSYPIDALRLPKHPSATITQINEDEWTVSLVNNKEHAESQTANVIQLNQDIAVYWRHKEGLPGSLDMVAYKQPDNNRGTVMMTFTPGADLGAINEGKDWVFVLDISGSMSGKYATLIEGISQGLKKLRTQDRFKVVLFNDNAINLSNGFQHVNPESINAILKALENYDIGGSTNLYAGLQEGLQLTDADRPAGVILVTDGVANVGITEKKSFLELLKKQDVRLFTFIMGNSANRPLLKEMATISKGFAMSISNADDIVGQLLLATSKLTHQAFRDISLDINGIKVKDITPQDINSLYQGEQLTVFGHYWGSGNAKVTLTAMVGNQKKTYQTVVNFPKEDIRNPEIERLWAFGAIENLKLKSDYLGEDKDIEQAITDIATEFGLVTDYTSMLVVEESVFQAMNIDRQNKRRVETEHTARAARKNTKTQNNQADIEQPMFNSPRPTTGSGGGGAFNPLYLFGLLTLLIFGKSIQFKKARMQLASANHK